MERQEAVATTIWGSTSKPASSRLLAQLLDGRAEVDGTLYIGYPILGTPDGAFPFDALLLSPTLGLVAFDIVEGKDLGNFQNRQDDLFSKLKAKLLQYPSLVRRRELIPQITVITYAPAAVTPGPIDPEYPVLDDVHLLDHLQKIDAGESEVFPSVAAAIQALTNIRKGRRRRSAYRENSRGAKLQALNDSIATLDADQSAAVVETVDGVQRIRGLAGSGKTIVLALKVAYLHAQNPDWKIAVTFNTRSLKGQFERLINTFVIEQTSEEPDWDNIKILHSWGSSYSDGIYYGFCRDHGLPYRDFKSAQGIFGDGKEFEGACAEAISTVPVVKQAYDAVLIDEAQDLPPSFMRLCYLILRQPKRLVYAYDELQSLTDASLPGPEDLFGSARDGKALVVFEPAQSGRPRQDIILERCYRNSRPVLATAHALGFGIYREPGGLIQIFEQNNLWQDVGYRVRDGSLNDGDYVSLERTDETSPRFLEAHSAVDDLIVFKTFNSRKDQDDWLVDAIAANIKDEDLLPEDIVVINPDPLSTRKLVGNARAALLERGINSSLAGVSTSPDIFTESDVVTFTGVFRAKGNEAGMIYVINGQDCFDSAYPPFRARIRNRLFTAITRSKAWVRVLGVGNSMRQLEEEFNRIKEHQFRLEFVYPNEEQKKELRIINRDLTRAERSKVKKKVDDLAGVLESLETGDVQIEDLPENLRERLRAILAK